MAFRLESVLLGCGGAVGSLLVSASLGCVLPTDSARHRQIDRLILPHLGELVFKAGEAERLVRSDSFAVSIQDDAGDARAIERSLIKEIRRRIPSWQYLQDENAADVLIRYGASYSICIDCNDLRALPQWARVEIVIRHGLARAEWADASHSHSRTRLVKLFAEALANAWMKAAARKGAAAELR